MLSAVLSTFLRSRCSGSQHVRALACGGPAFLSRHFSAGAAPSAVPYQQPESLKALQPAELPSSADVVIVGGGIAGCSLLYHLTCLGTKDVVLVEKGTVTSGTTWHSAGILWGLGGSVTKVGLLRRTQQLASSILEKETGNSTGWLNNGSLFLAESKERWTDYRRSATLTKALGINCEVLEPADVKGLYPLMDVSSLLGAVFCPDDGSVEPSGLTAAYVKAASARGAKIVENCAVTRIETTDSVLSSQKVSGVITERGRIRTDCVVNCAGAWAPQLGSLAGVSVPLAPYRHAYVVTEAIDGMRGKPNLAHRDHHMYFKLQGEGLVFGGYETDPIRIDNISAHPPFTLNEIDWDLFSPFTEAAVSLIPTVADAGIKSTVCGPESFTPDTRPLLGESPELQGFFLSCGFNSGGVMLSGGCGQQMAEWIAHGSPTLDMSKYDISRFAPRVKDKKCWLVDRCHEGFRKHHFPAFPNDEPLAGRNVSRDSLHEALLKAGCVYVDETSWEVPGWFLPPTKFSPAVLDYDYDGGKEEIARHTDYLYRDVVTKNHTFDFLGNHALVGAECSACRNKAAIFNMSARGKFLLFGEDALKAANWLFTSDMDLPSGVVSSTCALNRHGTIELSLNICRLDGAEKALFRDSDSMRGNGSAFYFSCAAGAVNHFKTHLRRVLDGKGFHVSLADVSEDIGVLVLQGPKSRKILQRLTSTDLSSPDFSTLLCHAPLSIHSHPLHAFCLSPTGEVGWELHTPMSSLLHVYETIWSAGQSSGLCNGGIHALKSLSLEKGHYSWPSDINSCHTPVEAGLQSVCSVGKDYLGCDVVAQQLQNGVQSRLVSFTVDRGTDCPPLHGGEVIKRNGEVVGTISRAGYSHTLQQHIGTGYVESKEGPINSDFLEAGQYELDVMGRTFPSMLHLRSPFDPDNQRAHGQY